MQTQQGVDAQLAFTNSLGIRADFERGPLTNEQMFNVFPFENTIVVMYLSGQEIQDTLDFVSRKSAARGCRSQLQSAGITFDMVCRDDPASADKCTSIDPAASDVVCSATVPCPGGDRCETGRCIATACSKNIYLGDGCRPKDSTTGQILSDAPVDPATTPCARLEPNGLYRVAVNNYIAAGGSGFTVLKRNTSQQDTGVSLRDSLTVYLTKQAQTCDGMTTDQIIDDTDPQTPQRTIKDRWGNASCLDDQIEAHDGRIRPVFQ
jgi:5'-nucleotidase / UDP-sugar diphosphatase